jgi:2-polyprenyl-3-methyl-5-hydroxy-6-metoxy-1,4-benzoquinol methylase
MFCLICGGNDWRALPEPNQHQSMTTSGVLIRQKLEREQCMTCGLLRKRDGEFLGRGRFYEEQYAKYYERPGGTTYDAGRYTAMARWMKAALGDEFAPASILDIGCGAGWQMRACQEAYKKARIEGVEPSATNAERARSAGFTVHAERFGVEKTRNTRYDLIYANNVLQHVVDPLGFLKDIADHLSPGGRVALIMPDASEPSNEMLWYDHNYSFRPKDLSVLSTAAGLHLENWQPNPDDKNLLDKQLVVLALKPRPVSITPPTAYSAAELFERRAAYLAKWRDLDNKLLGRISRHDRVFNFGASMWTWLLAGYCDQYWNKVNLCLVDGEHGRCLDKEVVPTATATFKSGDCIVLGVNPANQAAFGERFGSQGVHIIKWSDQIAS